MRTLFPRPVVPVMSMWWLSMFFPLIVTGTGSTCEPERMSPKGTLFSGVFRKSKSCWVIVRTEDRKSGSPLGDRAIPCVISSTFFAYPRM